MFYIMFMTPQRMEKPIDFVITFLFSAINWSNFKGAVSDMFLSGSVFQQQWLL